MGSGPSQATSVSSASAPGSSAASRSSATIQVAAVAAVAAVLAASWCPMLAQQAQEGLDAHSGLGQQGARRVQRQRQPVERGRGQRRSVEAQIGPARLEQPDRLGTGEARDRQRSGEFVPPRIR